MQNTDGFSEFVHGFPGNRLQDSVVEILTKSAQPLVALDIQRRGDKGWLERHAVSNTTN